MSKIEVKIKSWIHSREWFVIKVRKKGSWFWSTVKEIKFDVIDGDYFLSDIVKTANEENWEEAMLLFNCWEDYLEYKENLTIKLKTLQKQFDKKVLDNHNRLNNFYKK